LSRYEKRKLYCYQSTLIRVLLSRDNVLIIDLSYPNYLYYDHKLRYDDLKRNEEMKFSTFTGLITSGQFGLLLGLRNIFQQSYRSSFVTAALSEGLYKLLRDGPASLDKIHQQLIGNPSTRLTSGVDESREKLKVWLDVGVSLGELRLTPAGYALHSRLARQLAQPTNDGIAAMYQEVCTLHHDLLTQTPARLREKRYFTFSDTNGELIARSSRILEPYILEVVDAVVPEKGVCRLFEVGCGSGVYIRRACQRNPGLTAVGLELQPAVADSARQSLQTWGLAERVSLETGDIREYATPERFDLVTLHNNIYYFPIPERLDLLRRLASFLNPGGKIVVTSACQGSPSTMMLNLWGEMTAGAGALPEADALWDLLGQAGFISLRKIELLPGGGFFAFVGTQG
jgi:4-hydroxy-2,2'-bipyrrole-5-carbaldehyde O-methyltransferase